MSGMKKGHRLPNQLGRCVAKQLADSGIDIKYGSVQSDMHQYRGLKLVDSPPEMLKRTHDLSLATQSSECRVRRGIHAMAAVDSTQPQIETNRAAGIDSTMAGIA